MSTEAIARLRSLFETELTHNPTLYHETDISRMRTEDWQIRRYLIEHDSDETKAYAALLATLQWKKSYGIHERTDQYFPKELWDMSQNEAVGRDKAGHFVAWEATKGQRTFKELAQLHRQYAVHIIEKFDRIAGEAGLVLVGDTNGSSLFNIDTGLQQFKVEIQVHYPAVIKAFYIVDTPWILTAVFKLIMSFMNPKMRALVNFIKSEQVQEYVDPQWIPVAIKGGLRDKLVQPDGLVPLEDRAKDLGLEEKFVDNFYKTLKIKRK